MQYHENLTREGKFDIDLGMSKLNYHCLKYVTWAWFTRMDFQGYWDSSLGTTSLIKVIPACSQFKHCYHYQACIVEVGRSLVLSSRCP